MSRVCATTSSDAVMVSCRFTYEVAPVFVLLEYVTLKKMREIIGWPNGRGDGIFSPGTWALTRHPLFPAGNGTGCVCCNVSICILRTKMETLSRTITVEQFSSSVLLTPPVSSENNFTCLKCFFIVTGPDIISLLSLSSVPSVNKNLFCVCVCIFLRFNI